MHISADVFGFGSDCVFARVGLCPLHIAILANSLSSMRALLQAGADVEVQERTCGRTPLHLATEHNNVSLAGCLLLEVCVYMWVDGVAVFETVFVPRISSKLFHV